MPAPTGRRLCASANRTSCRSRPRGGAHYTPIKQAVAAGCHVFCDKPMTHSGDTAAELHQLAQEKGVKTAYAASFRYAPSVLHAKHLVAHGAIGAPVEVECISHFNLERNIPFGWSHRRADGGGRLNNNFTHTLSIVTSIIGDKVLSVSGEVRDDLGRAPIVEGVHNFATRRDFIPENLDDPALKWGESDVEWSYTVLAQLQSPMADKPVSVLFKHGGLVPRYHDDHIVFYGTRGAIHIQGHYGTGQLSLYSGTHWVDLPLPVRSPPRCPIPLAKPSNAGTPWPGTLSATSKARPFRPIRPSKKAASTSRSSTSSGGNDNWTELSHLA